MKSLLRRAGEAVVVMLVPDKHLDMMVGGAARLRRSMEASSATSLGHSVYTASSWHNKGAQALLAAEDNGREAAGSDPAASGKDLEPHVLLLRALIDKKLASREHGGGPVQIIMVARRSIFANVCRPHTPHGHQRERDKKRLNPD